MQPASVAWIYLKDEEGRNVSRYAYLLEDMQGGIDGRVAGNMAGEEGGHVRATFPDPPAKPTPEGAPPMSAVAIGVLDPAYKEESRSAQMGASLTSKIMEGRPAMLSPDSVIGAAGLTGPAGDAWPRSRASGLLADPVAAVVERDVSAVNRSYLEQPLVPFTPGLAAKVVGKPKVNLNRLLAAPRASAVADFAAWVDDGLPDFGENRKGGFPDDYLKTLAAGALDYADEDGDPTISPGSYLGVDNYPLLSEIVLHIEFKGAAKEGSRHVLRWRFRLFAELWNMTNQPITAGAARLSYEVNLKPETMGASAESLPFDDPSILLDPTQSVHDLTRIDGKFYGPEREIRLQADEYRFYEFATVNYSLDYSPALNSKGQPKSVEFDLLEPEQEARGITLRWNGEPVQVLHGIVRDAHGVSNFKTTQPRFAAKAAIPGHGYGAYGFFINNMLL